MQSGEAFRNIVLQSATQGGSVDYLPLAIAALIFWAGLREGRLALEDWINHRETEADTDRQFQSDLLETKQTNILEEIKARAEAEQNAANKWAQAGSAMRAGQDQDSDEPEDAAGREIPLDDYRTP